MKMIKIFVTIVILIAFFLVIRVLTVDKDMSGITPEFVLPSEIEDEIIARIEKGDVTVYDNVVQINNLSNAGEWYAGEKYNQLERWREIEQKRVRWYVEDTNEVAFWENYLGYGYKKILVEKGFLLIINKGEWGGALYYYPESNKKERYKIQDGNIVDIYKMNDIYYAVESEVYGGKLLKLRNRFGKWSAKEIMTFNDTPYAISEVDKSTVYVVTNYELLKIEDDKIEDVIISDAFWSGLYPSSIVYNEYFYIGMRGGVAKVNPETKEIQFCDIPDSIE